MKITKSEFTWKDRQKNRSARIYFFHNENVMENLANRRARSYRDYKKLLPAIYQELGLPENTKVRWSQRAGCSCPCSPGFIVQGFIGLFDIMVDLDATDAVPATIFEKKDNPEPIQEPVNNRAVA